MTDICVMEIYSTILIPRVNINIMHCMPIFRLKCVVVAVTIYLQNKPTLESVAGIIILLFGLIAMQLLFKEEVFCGSQCNSSVSTTP